MIPSVDHPPTVWLLCIIQEHFQSTLLSIIYCMSWVLYTVLIGKVCGVIFNLKLMVVYYTVTGMYQFYWQQAKTKIW